MRGLGVPHKKGCLNSPDRVVNPWAPIARGVVFYCVSRSQRLRPILVLVVNPVFFFCRSTPSWFQLRGLHHQPDTPRHPPLLIQLGKRGCDPLYPHPLRSTFSCRIFHINFPKKCPVAFKWPEDVIWMISSFLGKCSRYRKCTGKCNNM